MSATENKIEQVAACSKKESRGARSKKRTRDQLLSAGLILATDNGLDGVTINEITNKADVGFGSFYNHFDSKEKLYEELTNRAINKLSDTIDIELISIKDPAEKLSIALRTTLLSGAKNPLWITLFVKEVFTHNGLTNGTGTRIIRYINEGVESGRFNKVDSLIQLLSIRGAILACMSLQADMSNPGSAHPPLINLKDDLSFDLGERLVKNVLVNLGISAEEAVTISTLPLPSETLDL